MLAIPVVAQSLILPTLPSKLLRFCVLVPLIVVASGGAGCRHLVRNSSNQSLVSARQLSLRGTDALQRERIQDAELLFSQALAQSPYDERAHWGYATTRWKNGDKQKGVQHMTEAYRLSGRNPDYAIQLGELYLALDQLDPAKQMALEVLAANRNHAPAWALLGDTHRSQSDWPSALECYHHALLIRGDYPKVQYSVADIYRTIGRPERALSTLDHMVDLHSSVADDTQFMFLKGVALADLNRPKDALEILAKCSEKLPPDDWQKQLQIAETQARLSDLVAARMALGRIPSDRSGTPAVRKIRERLDSDFLQLANATNPSVAAGKDLPSGAIPSLYLAEPAKFPAIQR